MSFWDNLQPPQQPQPTAPIAPKIPPASSPMPGAVISPIQTGPAPYTLDKSFWDGVKQSLAPSVLPPKPSLKTPTFWDKVDVNKKLPPPEKNDLSVAVQKYNDLDSSFQKDADSLATEIKQWNDKGGAPEDVYQTLNQRQKDLQGRLTQLNSYGQTVKKSIQTAQDNAPLPPPEIDESKAPFIEPVKQSALDLENRASDFLQTINDPKAGFWDKTTKAGLLVTGAINTAFSPLTALLKEGEKLPGGPKTTTKIGNIPVGTELPSLRTAFVGIDKAFQKIGKVSEWEVNQHLDAIPSSFLSDEAKEKVKPLLSDIANLVNGFAVGAGVDATSNLKVKEVTQKAGKIYDIVLEEYKALPGKQGGYIRIGPNGEDHPAFGEVKKSDPTKDNKIEENQKANQENTDEVVNETLTGKREDSRLDKPLNLQNAKDYGVVSKDATPETVTSIFRAGKNEIQSGDHVSLSEVGASKYIPTREGSKLQSREVPLKDLVRSKGTGNEFIYAPKADISGTPTGNRTQTTSLEPKQPNPLTDEGSETISQTRENNKKLEHIFNNHIEGPIEPTQENVEQLSRDEDISPEHAKRIIAETFEGKGPQKPIVETNKALGDKHEFRGTGAFHLDEKYKNEAQIIDEIKKGQVSNRYERIHVANLPESFAEKGHRQNLHLTYEVIDKTVKLHGSFPIPEFIKTSYEPDAIVTYPIDKNGLERLNIIKKIGNETYLIGAVRVNGYNVTTFFDISGDEKETQKYLQSLEKRGGTLAYNSGEARISLFTSSKEKPPEKQLRSHGAQPESIKRSELSDKKKVSSIYKKVNRVSEYDKKEPKVPSNPVEQKIQDMKTQASFLEETIRNHPANKLTKYANKNGELPEVLGNGKKGIFKNKGDDIVTEAGYPDSETARSDYQNLKLMKKRLQSYKDEIKDVSEKYRSLKSDNKDAQHLSKFLENSFEKLDGNMAKLASKNEKPEETVQELTQRKIKAQKNLEKLINITYNSTAPLERMTPEHILNLTLESYNMTLQEFEQMQDSSIRQITGTYQTPLKKRVGIIDYLRTPDRVLKKIGLPKVSGLLRSSYENYLGELPLHIELIKEWKSKVDPKANEDIFRYLDGQDTRDYYAGKTQTRLAPNELKVANEIKKYLAEWADRLGLPEDEKISHYITHIFGLGENAKEFDEDVAKIIADKVPGSVYDPFLEKRLGAKGYLQDTWKALDAYVKRAVRKANMDPVLERLSLESETLELSQQRYIKRYVDRINMRPTEIDSAIDNTLKSLIGYRFGQRPVAYLSRAARQVIFRSSIGGSVSAAIKDLTQGVNTYSKLGEKYTLIGYTKLFTQGTKELTENGVLSQDMVQDKVLSASRQALEKVDKGLFFLFDLAEKINRGGAYYGAKAKGLAEGMNEQQAIEYAKKLVRDTQFQFGSIDTPVGVNSDIGKIFTQFMSYGLKQTEFAAEMIGQKQWLGIGRYILASLALVYFFGKAFDLKGSDFVPFSSFLRFGNPPTLALPEEIIKAVLDTPDQNGNPRTATQKGKDILNQVPFPASVQAKKTVAGVKALSEDKTADSIPKTPYNVAKTLLYGPKNVPTVKDNVNTTYDKVQSLIASGKTDEAQKLVDGLTADEYTIYKDIRSKDKLNQAKSVYAQVQDLSSQGKKTEAQKIVDGLSDAEYKEYEHVKTLQKNKIKPTYQAGDQVKTSDLLSNVVLYAKAIGTDPETAFNRIFTGQRIRRVDNGAIIVERLPFLSSTKIKQDQGGNNPTMKLDHTVPLELGGSNDVSNLKLVPTDVWASYTPVENKLGTLLRSGKIDKQEAQRLIQSFKSGQTKAEDILKL